MCVCACTGEVISESTEDADDSGYHAEREDIVGDEDHIAAVSTKGKAEVHVFTMYIAIRISSSWMMMNMLLVIFICIFVSKYFSWSHVFKKSRHAFLLCEALLVWSR